MRALNTAATGMLAQEMNVEVISHNIANMRTTGYKRQRVQFQDLMYENLRRQGTATSEAGTQVPTGVQIGSGVKLSATPRVHSQGTLTPTEKTYDVAVRGEGFLRVTTPDGKTAYTRDGSLELDSQGRLVTAEGYLVADGITVPQNAASVTISQTGSVQATLPGQTDTQTLGQLQLARFINNTGLNPIGDNLFLETAASGPAVLGNPQTEGFGNVLQGYLEEANVNAVTDISELIAAQRAYEMNARVIKGADEMMSSNSRM